MILPDPEHNISNLKNFKFKESVPFVVYADLECILEETGNQKFPQKHVPHSVAFYLPCAFDNNTLSRFECKRSCDCVEWFINKLKEISQLVNYYVNRIIPLAPLTNEQTRDFYTTRVCHMCNKPFITTDAKHSDHDHFTGKYRGAAHQGCNVNYKKSSSHSHSIS